MTSMDKALLKAIENVEDRVEDTNPFKDKWVSILGDSISTYRGYVPDGNGLYYPNNDVDDVSKTWWHILLTKLGAKLCVNQSSAARLLVDSDDNSVLPAVKKLHREKDSTYVNLDGNTEIANEDIKPDVILILIGTNDFLNNKKIGEATLKCNFSKPEEANFSDYFNFMLLQLACNYPNAQIYCLDMIFCASPSFLYPISGGEKAQPAWQQVIRDEAQMYGSKCLHVSSIGVHGANQENNLIDKIHPKAIMMEKIANQCYHEMISDNCL